MVFAIRFGCMCEVTVKEYRYKHREISKRRKIPCDSSVVFPYLWLQLYVLKKWRQKRHMFMSVVNVFLTKKILVFFFLMFYLCTLMYQWADVLIKHQKVFCPWHLSTYIPFCILFKCEIWLKYKPFYTTFKFNFELCCF